MKKVFVSYATDDKDKARMLLEALRDAEVSGWMDESDLTTGGASAQKMRDSIRRASAVIVLISEQSVKSKWVQFELGAAFEMGKPIIPILIGKAGIEKKLPVWLEGIAYLDARKRPLKDVIKEVTQAISSGQVI